MSSIYIVKNFKNLARVIRRDSDPCILIVQNRDAGGIWQDCQTIDTRNNEKAYDVAFEQARNLSINHVAPVSR